MNKSTGDPLVGTTVAQYEVVAKVGGGGMGVVYAAHDTRLGRRVALKFLPPQWSHDESAKQRFIREAQAASATDHRNICTIHDINETADGQLFIVMAHYDGPTLKQRLESGPLSVDEAIEIAAQIAEGLAKAHAQGVVHRDIKPGNLILTEDGVKILDFGLAKFADARLKLTLEGSTIGTIAYMSPEQARGEEADAGTDVWAAGVVLYEMLTGAVPFRGGYPEAIAHAIKTEPPASIRAAGHDIPEALEQLVFRALHKNRAVRFQSVRDLVRALRQLQGRTLPLDLRTEPLPPVTAPDAGKRGFTPRRSWFRSPAVWAAAAALALMLVGTPLWLFSPVERLAIAVAPVANRTGYAELDPYRLALTQQLIASLEDSRVVRPLPFDRLLQIVRRFRTAGDISSVEAIQAISAASGASIMLSPVLVYENNTWRVRVEVTAPGSDAVTYDTEPITSALAKDTVYGLVPQVARLVDEHFTTRGPRRAYAANVLRSAFGATASSGTLMRTLDAAAAFAEGIDAYEQQEHSIALRAFTAAAAQDSTNALPAAWRSRVARLMGQSRIAQEAAADASRLGTDRLRLADQLFVDAVIAESNREAPAAEARYRELVELHRDEPAWLIELGAFLDRQARYPEAEAAYLTALDGDERLARPHLELCRLYGPARRNDPPNARLHGEQALAAYRALEAAAGEAQTRWCLADVLNVGDAAARTEAMRHAEAARDTFEALRYEFNLSRAYNYLALTAGIQGRFTDAVAFWERSLATARTAGNATLEPNVLNNLSVIQERLGNVAAAIEYRQQGATLFDTLGDPQRAAQSQANGAFLLVKYGVNPELGIQEARNALAVVRKINDFNFEVFCLYVIGVSERNAGRYGMAEMELNRAASIASERVLAEDLAEVKFELGRVRFDQADYGKARTLLDQAMSGASGLDSTEATIHLARTDVRMGRLDAAQDLLKRAAADLGSRGETGLASLMALVSGELAYGTGRLEQARQHFADAAATWTGDFPHEAAVEAQARLGLLTANREQLRASLARATAMGRFGLAAQVRLYLGRLDITAGRFDSALRTLGEIPGDDAERTIGRELRAQVHYWRGRALAGRGDAAAARAAQEEARRVLDEIRGLLSESDRAAFSARPEIGIIG